MTIRNNLFYSFIAHAVMLAYLLSLPLYRGSLHLDSIGDIFVHLTSREVVSEEAGSAQKARASAATKAGDMAVKQKGTNAETTAQPVKSERAEEKAEQVPQNEIVLKEAPPAIEVREVKVKEEKQPEVKQTKEKKPPKIEAPRIDEIKKPAEIKEAKSVQPEPKVSEMKIEPEAKKVMDKKMVSEDAMTAEKPLKAPEFKKSLPEEKALAVDQSVEKKDEQAHREPAAQNEVIHEAKEKEPLKPSETKETAKPPPPIVEQKIDSGVKAGLKNNEIVKETLAKASPAQEVKSVALKAEAGKTKRSDIKKLSASQAFALRKGPSKEKKIEGKKDSNSKAESAGKKAAESVLQKAKEPLVLSGAQMGGPNVDQQSAKAAQLDAGKTGTAGGEAAPKLKPETKAQTGEEERKPSAGIPISEMLLLNDIKIEFFLKGAGISSISSHLFMSAHPAADGMRNTMKQKEVGIHEDNKGGPDRKRVVYVAKADKGLYTFVMRNESDTTYKTDIIVRLFEKKKSGKLKNFKGKDLSPHAELRIKFILPEAVFWDDEEYFTGAIESSDSVTKFNNGTGLIWKEDKDGGGI